jgi:hypothetical protein
MPRTIATTSACLALLSVASCATKCAESAAPPAAADPNARGASASSPAADTDAPQQVSGSERLGARIEALRRGGRDSVRYLQPSPDEERSYRAWVAAAAIAARDGAPPPQVAPEGFVLEQIDAETWLLAEAPQRKRGGGAVALRVGPAPAVVVEAPHTFFDVGTLPIALTAFQEQRARALIVNTVHRYRSRHAGDGPPDAGLAADEGEDEGKEESAAPSSDVAHAPRSFFLAAHEALLSAFPAIATVQLHGFRDAAAPGVALIASGAGTELDQALVERLRGWLGRELRVFPTEIQHLGGLTNVQAARSRAAGAPFVHVEMSRSLRDRLVADATQRRRLGAALVPASAERPSDAP